MNRLRVCGAFLLLLFLTLLWGCAEMEIAPTPAEQSITPPAQTFLNLLGERNRSLKTFKGTGKIIISTAEARRIARIAWIGDAPNRLRASVLDMAGRPVNTIAGDGSIFYAVSHTKLRLYKTSAENPKLKRIAQVPIRMQDAIALLTGKIPSKKFWYAKALSPRTLELSDHRQRPVQRIWFQNDALLPYRVDFFDRAGALTYRAELGDYRAINGGYQIPFSITVSGADARFQIQVERYWANTSTPPGVFVLNDPEKGL